MVAEVDRTNNSPISTFEKEVPVEVHLPEFEPFSSVGALDLAQLSRGEHRVEIGTLRDACCGGILAARIRNGQVVGIETEVGDDVGEDPSGGFGALFAEAMERLGQSGGREAVPVAEFFSSLNVGMPPPIGVSGCIRICIWGYCVTCCSSPGGGTYCVFAAPSRPVVQ